MHCSFGQEEIRNRCAVVLLFMIVSAGYTQARNGNSSPDPGIRGGPPGAGQSIAGLTPAEAAFFNNVGIPKFIDVETVADGLGPRFNLDSCGGCHAFPALGGSSPPRDN